jgi:hypothetical protein
MKILAQHGHQPEQKINRGLREGVIDGAIFSARYATPQKARTVINEARLMKPDAEILLDPEFYAASLLGTPNSQLGNLPDWPYFRGQKRRELIREQAAVAVLQKTKEALLNLEVSGYIAPSIYIPQSFDSMEAAAALNFIEQTKAVFGDQKPVYATLAVDGRAFLGNEDFRAFVNDLTALDNPPDGFYILVGGGPLSERIDLAQSDIIDAKVIGGWMFLNYVLAQNNFRVVNGFANVLTPFLGLAGGMACATGWWANLRVFSIGRYVKPPNSGGQTPTVRYLSKLLLNHIKITERFNYSQVMPEITNGLSFDPAYDSGAPDRTEEALQTWEALGSLSDEVLTSNISNDLATLQDRVTKAGEAYIRLRTYGITAGYEVTTDYLDQLEKGLEVFKQLAEL